MSIIYIYIPLKLPGDRKRNYGLLIINMDFNFLNMDYRYGLYIILFDCICYTMVYIHSLLRAAPERGRAELSQFVLNNEQPEHHRLTGRTQTHIEYRIWC